MKPIALVSMFLALTCACTENRDPLKWADARYVELLALHNAAHRDTIRNLHNKDARRRKIAAEKALLTFFHDPRLTESIDEARQAPEGSLIRTKGEAYWRHAVFTRSWKGEEKERETELLARLDAVSGAEATWGHPDGVSEIALNGRWMDVSREGDHLEESLRGDLAAEYVDHRMGMVGDELKELIKLRNRVARREGFETYWHLALFHRGLSAEQVDHTIEALHPVIQPVNHAYAQRVSKKAEELGLSNNFANHPFLRRASGLEAGKDEAESYFDTDLAEERILTTLRDMGISIGTPQLYYGPSRYTLRGAYSFPIRLPDLTALVISRDQRIELWFYEAMVHELGYISWWRGLGPDALASPVLWEPASAYMEGFAQTFERIFYEPEWAKHYLQDLPPQQREDLQAWRRRQVALQLTDAIVETAIEQRAYSDPNNWAAVARYCSDIEDVYEVYAGPTPHTHDGIPYCEALLIPLIWHFPGYVQNYIFSYVTEATLFDALEKEVGHPVANPLVGPWLKEHIIQEGGITSFPDRLAAVSPYPDTTEALRHYIRAPIEPEPTVESDD